MNWDRAEGNRKQIKGGAQQQWGRLTNDVHKRPPTKVPTPAGPLLIAALVLGELAIYLAHESTIPLAVIAVAVVAGGVWPLGFAAPCWTKVTFPNCTADCSCAAGCGAGVADFALLAFPSGFPGA